MIKFYRYPRVQENGLKYCYGVRLWKTDTKTIELWYIPKGVSLPIHRHPNQNIDLIPLYMDNNCIFNRRSMQYNHCLNHKAAIDEINKRGFTQSIKGSLFHAYTTPDGYYHWFSNRTKAIVFLSVTQWLNGVTPTSPSQNFVTLADDLYAQR